MTAGTGTPLPTASPAQDLLDRVFARPKDAVAGARRILAAHPAAADASIAYQILGIAERDFGDVNVAVGHLRRSVRWARQSGSAEREGDVLATLGIALIQCGRTGPGLETLARAVTLTTGRTAARVRFRRGAALWVLGRHDDALRDVQAALPVLRRSRDATWVARALTLRALIALARGATARADRDLDAAERLFSTTGQEHDAAVQVHNRGIAALRGGNLPRALAYLDEAAERYERLQVPSAELSLDRCTALLAGGLAVDALGEADAAIRRVDDLGGQVTRRAELLMIAAKAALAAGNAGVALTRAAAATRAFAAQQRRWFSVHSRLLMIEARFADGDITIQLVRQAQRIARELAALGSDQAVRAYLVAGRAALALHRQPAGERLLAIAAESRRRGAPLDRAGGWLAAALGAESRGDARRSLDACRRGLGVLHEYRLTLGASELRAQATAHGAELIAVAMRTCLREQLSPRRLLAWSEYWRATAVAIRPTSPPDDRRLRAELARYREITVRLDAAAASGAPSAPALKHRQLQAERGIRAFAMRADGGHGGDGRRHALEVPALIDGLGPAGLAEIVDIEGRLHVLWCSNGRVRHFLAGTMADAAVESEHALAMMRRLAHGASPRASDALARVAAAGQRLERILLGDAVAQLGSEPLTIVPPGPLHTVPWAVLPCLFERDFSIAPSADAWQRARAAKPPSRGGAVLIRGPGLAAEADEIAQIAALYHNPLVLRGASATASNVLAAMDGCAIAHIAAHGTFRADNPLFSALRMADGPLTGYDLERLAHAPARLVLPCCDSARLAAVGSDELLGLAAALLPLGTIGIVGSVVPISDHEVVPLMVTLHRGLARGASMAEALRDARVAATGGAAGRLASAWSLVALGAG